MQITLTPLSGPALSITFPGGHNRGSIDGCVRQFQRLGQLGVRYYHDIEGNESVWLANAHAGSGIQDFKTIRITSGIHEKTIGAGIECIPTRRGFVVRLGALAPKSIPATVTAFGPLSLPHPKVDRADYEARAMPNLMALRGAIALGTTWDPSYPGLDGECGLMLTGMGRWRPLGPQDAGAPGGSDVRFHPGYGQCTSEALLEQTRMDCAIERMLHAWDAVTGDALTVESFGDPGPQYTGGRDDENNGELPGFKRPGGPSQCPYVRKLEAVKAYDFAHYSRALNPAIVAWEYRQDPIAADAIVDWAEEARFAFSDRGSVADPAYDYSLRTAAERAAAKPGQGGGAGRLHGWQGWAVAMANRVRPRHEYQAWSRMFQRWAEKTQMVNGLYQRHVEPPLWGPHASSQAFEQAIFGMALLAQPGSNANTDAAVEKMAAAMYSNRRVPLQPDPWSGTTYGPHHFLWVAPHGWGEEPYGFVKGGSGNYEGDKGTGDPAHCEALLGALYFVTGKLKYLGKSLEVNHRAGSLAEKKSAMGPDLSWTGILLAGIQKAGL